MPVFDTSQTMMAGSAAQAGAGVDVGTYTGKSCIFTGTNEFLTKTWGAAATDLDKFTISLWIKRNNVDSGSSQYWIFGAQTGAESNIKIQADKINVHLTGSNYDFVGTRLLRDTTNWYHLVFRYDSDESAAGDRFRCYINGELETWASSSTIPSGQDNEFLANTNKMTIGAYDASNHRFNGYIAQVVALDGQSLAPTSFIDTSSDTGSVVMKDDFSGLTFGDNGFLLEFKETGTGTASTSTIGADTSGETNHFTSTNLASTDSARPDTPVDNHPTWNVIGTATPGAASVTFAEGNRQFQTPDGNGQNIGVSSVAFDAANDTFVEFLVDAKGSSTAGSIGILPEDEFTIYGYSQPSLYGGGGSTGAHCYIVDGNKSLAGATNASYGNTYDTGDRIGMRINAGSLFFYKNGTIQNSGTAATTGITGKWLFAVTGDYGFDVTVRVNSGDWTDAPSGMTSSNQISSAYLPDLEIGQESDDLATNHYNTILYTGNTTTPRTISGVGFEPGITLIKGRSVAGAGLFFDDVRGAGSNKQLSLSNEDEEGTDGSYNSATYGFLSAFNADGFVLTDGSSNGNWVNENGTTFASYNWRLGTAHSGTTSGSGDDESYSAQVDADAGIGLVAYEGNGTSGHTIPHNLSKAPEFIVARRRTPDNAWFVFHTGVASDPETDYLVFDTNAAVADQTAMWNDTAPSSTMITVGDSSGTNTDGNNYIMWYMHSVDGFSKFGAYTGNNNAGGPFVYCGFRPAMVITRRTDSGDHWRLIDNKRHPVNDGSNPGHKLNDAETEADAGNRNVDFVSNGFKVRETDPDSNADGGNYVYMAFAATPFKYSNAY